MWPGMNFNHSKMAYWVERSRSVLDSTNYLIVSLSSNTEASLRRVEAGEREKWKRHLALSIFKSLPFLMDTQREPLRRSELQYSFLLFFLLAEIDKKYCLPIDLVVFSFFKTYFATLFQLVKISKRY